MASFFQDMKHFLLTSTDVKNSVGSDDQARIYSRQLKDRCDMPAVVLTRFPGESFGTLASGDEELERSRLQVDCYAMSEDESEALMKTIHRLLCPTNTNFYGNIGEGSDRYIDSVLAEGTPRELGNAPVKGDVKWRYWHSRDYQIIYST